MYVPVMIYSEDAQFLGWTIKLAGAEKLQTTNVWNDNDYSKMEEQIERLNNKTGIMAHWPHYNDPEVQALLGDPAWEPVADEPVEVVDEENSIFVWRRRPTEEDPLGDRDEPASTLVYKYVMMPPPVLVQARVKKAQETVARKRAGIEE